MRTAAGPGWPRQLRARLSRAAPAPPPQEPGQAFSLGLSHACKRWSTIIIIINWFISHATFCLLDSPTARKRQCPLAGAGLSLTPSHSCQSTFRQDHSTHLLQPPTPSVPSLQGTLLYGCKADPKAGSVLLDTQKSSHALICQPKLCTADQQQPPTSAGLVP